MPCINLPARRLPKRALLLVVAAAAAFAATAPAPAEAANSCRSASTAKGNKIIVASGSVVVFSSRKAKQNVACSYKYKRRIKLDKFACCQLLRFVPNRRYLAYAYRLDEAFNEVDEMGVLDLKTGKRLKYGSSPRVETFGYARSFSVTPKGTLVWVQQEAETDDNPNPTGATVRAAAPGKPIQELDKGNVDVHSLALASGGKTLYWTKDGIVHSATVG